MNAEELIKNIDWSELRNQKRTLLGVIDKHYNNIASESLNDSAKDDLEGLVNLIDSLQDYAVDQLGIDSIHVFDFDDEDPKDGETLIPIVNLKEVEFSPESKNLLISIINNFGDGQHPNCDEQTFNYFQIDYVKNIIKDNDEKISSSLNEVGQVVFTSIKKRLGIL